MIIIVQLCTGCVVTSQENAMIDGHAIVGSVHNAGKQVYNHGKRYRVVVYSLYTGRNNKILRETVIYTDNTYIPGDTIRLQP